MIIPKILRPDPDDCLSNRTPIVVHYTLTNLVNDYEVGDMINVFVKEEGNDGTFICSKYADNCAHFERVWED